MKTKLFHYVTLTEFYSDGYRHQVHESGTLDTGQDNWILVGEVEVDLPDPELICQRGLDLCDESEKKAAAEYQLKLNAIADMRAKYTSLPAPCQDGGQ